eukprot:gene574-464_t
MGKDKTANPAMAQRRKDKQKEKAKLKKRRVDDFASQVKFMDPDQIKKELRHYENLDKKGELKFAQHHKWEQLKATADKFKDEIADNAAKRQKLRREEQEETRFREMRQYAKFSVYYDAKMNPLGAPPPGQPTLYKHPDGSISSDPPRDEEGDQQELVNPFLPKKKQQESSDDSDGSEIETESDDEAAAVTGKTVAPGYGLGPGVPPLPKSRPPGAPPLPKGHRPGAAPLPKGPPPRPPMQPSKTSTAAPPVVPPKHGSTASGFSSNYSSAPSDAITRPQFPLPPGPPPKKRPPPPPPSNKKHVHMPKPSGEAPQPVVVAPSGPVVKAPAPKPMLLAPVSVRMKHKPQIKKVSSQHVSGVGQVTAFSTSVTALKKDTVVSEKPFQKSNDGAMDEMFAAFMDSIDKETE